MTYAVIGAWLLGPCNVWSGQVLAIVGWVKFPVLLLVKTSSSRLESSIINLDWTGNFSKLKLLIYVFHMGVFQVCKPTANL